MDGAWAGGRKRQRLRLNLRGVLILLLAIAVGLALLRPFAREPIDWIERRARVILNKPDIDRHINQGASVAFQFAEDFRSGRLDEARELMTADFRRRIPPSEMAAMAARSPLGRSPCELVEGVLRFSEGHGKFVSDVVFRCGRGQGGDEVVMVLVTEAGRLKVDRIEPREPKGR